MKKILFVCHGNICRSPMAEFVMKDLVQHAGLENEIFVASA
ncbi:MAG: low molecular weight phosphotyrosine protein phosphatase, partial [Schwartzia sp.]|nr:low molecular weight phosphotyrosine protein phosphatase [Schwartzia sp. (in: firmicutes)]